MTVKNVFDDPALYAPIKKAGEKLAKAIDVDTGGAAQPPGEKPPVAAAAVDPVESVTCPETNTVCTEGCVLPEMTGRTYCARWVRSEQANEIERRTHGKDS